jgi:hypothetical protein
MGQSINLKKNVFWSKVEHKKPTGTVNFSFWTQRKVLTAYPYILVGPHGKASYYLSPHLQSIKILPYSAPGRGKLNAGLI